MKRAIISTIFVTAYLCSFYDNLYACDELPVPDIVSPTGTVYSSIDGYVDFNGYDSFDPDNGYPYGEGHGIDEYCWWVWGLSEHDYVFQDYDDDPYYTIYPGDFGEPGRVYSVELWVRDDEGNWSDDYESYNLSVIDMEITQPSTQVFIALGDTFQLQSYACPGGGDYDWSKASGSGSVTFSPNNEAANPTFSANAADDYTVELEYTVTGSCNSASESDTSKIITVVDIEITTPYGNPQTNEGANSTNERTFNPSSPGVLTVSCEATPDPDTTAVRNYLNNNRVRWTVDTIGGSTLTWDSSWPGDSTKGQGLFCTATFTNLPTSNSDFGLKEVKMELLMDGSSVDITDTTNIEVFYSKTATNNPGGSDANWFYYWNQAVGDPGAVYKVGTGGSCVPAMAWWAPDMTYSKSEIWISDSESGELDGISGIDLFSNYIKHEKVHVTQISQADSLLTGNGTGVWAKGWSFNYNPNPNNHYNNDPYDDLDDDDDDIPDAYESANPEWIEPAANAAMDTEEGDNTSSDWGDHGKQHKTIGKYDD